MKKIAPFLWFDNQAEEAVRFYTSLFKNSAIKGDVRYDDEGANASGRPKGTVMTVPFQIEGQEFVALNGGPIFKFTPAVSFFVSCEAHEEIDKLWDTFSEGGKVLMEFQQYPFSEKFGWLQDKFGLSWQLNLGRRAQKIAPFLLFVGKQHGKAEEAMKLYISLFKNSSISRVERYGAGESGAEGTVKHAVFSLGGQEFMAMDSNLDHHFTFNEAISFVVNCETQKEVDYYWEKLSAGGDEKAQQCGWLKDKYGVSWQIVPTILPELLQDKNPVKSQRVMKAMLQMKKIDIDSLQRAYEQR